MKIKKNKKFRVGILTSGGDCPGLNAAIRGVGKAAILNYGMEVIGIASGYQGLINKEYEELKESDLSGILTMGGTILRTSREKPFKKTSDSKYARGKPEIIKSNYESMDLDCLVCIGGNGTQKTAHKLAMEGLNIVSIPKTIDNDVWGTDFSFGFDSALSVIVDALDRLHTTANSHKRTMVLEVMGHKAGWLALHSGIAGGADLILIPEIKFNEESIISTLKKRFDAGKPYSIVVVAEGINTPGKDKGVSAGEYISRLIDANTEQEARLTILGYTQRGGTPSSFDRVLATGFGSYTADMIQNKDFNKIAVLNNNRIVSLALEEVSGKIKTVPLDDQLIKTARSLGTAFGD